MELARPGFSVYLTIAWPSPTVFHKLLEALEPCVDYLELGIPSRRPIYDGPTIRSTHREATRHVTGLEALKLVKDAGFGKPFLVMAYLAEHRLEDLLRHSAEAGAASMLLPDLPFEQPSRIGEYVEEARRHGMRPSLFASTKFPHHMLHQYRSTNPLLVYLGLQPATGVRLPARMLENISLARSLLGDTYLLAGFSISSGDQARSVIQAGASGVVVGSHIAKTFRRGGVEAATQEACRLYEAVHGGG